MKPLAPEIRAILKKFPDGLTTGEVTRLLERKPLQETVKVAMNNMPDVYIDRWVVGTARNKALSAVWVAVEVPEDCPHPTRSYRHAVPRT